MDYNHPSLLPVSARFQLAAVAFCLLPLLLTIDNAVLDLLCFSKLSTHAEPLPLLMRC
jgi:hypothetical protein